MKSPYEILERPLLTEKATELSEKENVKTGAQIVFKVRPDANKVEIKKAVEQHYKVKVAKVTTLNMLGKKKRVRFHMGRRAHWKKAYVILAKGQEIDLY